MGCLHCGAKKCFVEDVRHRAGSCLIVCALPLLVPGVIMTAVAFQDEIAFKKYSSAHVLGMLLLAVAVLAFVAGVVLSVRTHSKIAPDNCQQPISTHKESNTGLKLETAFTSNECPARVPDDRDSCRSYASHTSYFVESNDNNQPNFFTETVYNLSDRHPTGITKISTTTRTLESSSSSDDGLDSDDCSSGSYSIPEDDRFPITPTVSHYTTAKQIASSSLNPKLTNEKKLELIYYRATVPVSFDVPSNNLFHDDADDLTTELIFLCENKKEQSLLHEDQSNNHNETKQIENRTLQEHGDLCKSHTPPVPLAPNPTSEIHIPGNGPGVRPRLLGLSSEDVVTPPGTPGSPVIVVIPAKLCPSQFITPLEDTVIRSSPSLSSIVPESTTIRKQDNAQNDNSFWRMQLNHHKPLIRSPYATRPYSFPLSDKSRGGPAGSGIRTHSLGQKQLFSRSRRRHRKEAPQRKAVIVHTRVWYP